VGTFKYSVTTTTHGPVVTKPLFNQENKPVNDQFFQFRRVAFFAFIVLVIVGLLGLSYKAVDSTYSEGYRDGVIQKFSYKGFIWDTYEGELGYLGFGTGSRKRHTNGESWDFTVRDPEVAKKINKIPAGSIVRLHYRQVFIGLPWRGDTDYYVEGVDILSSK
jgi:hypothetical protein